MILCHKFQSRGRTWIIVWEHDIEQEVAVRVRSIRWSDDHYVSLYHILVVMYIVNALIGQWLSADGHDIRQYTLRGTTLEHYMVYRGYLYM